MNTVEDCTISEPSANTKFFVKLNTIYYLAWCPGFWFKDVPFSSNFVKFYDKYTLFIQVSVGCFHVLLLGAFFTQNHLDVEQTKMRLRFGIICPGTMLFYLFLLPHKKEVRHILYVLMIELKKNYNYTVLEKDMFKKISKFSFILCLFCYSGIVANGIKAGLEVVTKGEKFITLIPAWPDVLDTSAMSIVINALVYIYWWIYAFLITATMSIIVSMLIGTCYQFKNLQSYFYSLNEIFDDKHLSQEEKEMKYEQAFKLGIQMHVITLGCKDLTQKVCREIFAFMTILFSGVLMTEVIAILGAERDLADIGANAPITLTTLVNIGFFMWTGGDITVEASILPTAMYSSGWEHCQGRSSVRIRKLAVRAIAEAQRPVVYTTLGVINFSYETYVCLVKAPYTMVSVFY